MRSMLGSKRAQEAVRGPRYLCGAVPDGDLVRAGEVGFPICGCHVVLLIKTFDACVVVSHAPLATGFHGIFEVSAAGMFLLHDSWTSPDKALLRACSALLARPRSRGRWCYGHGCEDLLVHGILGSFVSRTRRKRMEEEGMKKVRKGREDKKANGAFKEQQRKTSKTSKAKTNNKNTAQRKIKETTRIYNKQ